jgi:hypothetical protein
MISTDTTIVAVTQQVSTNISGEVVILNLANGVYYGLNEIGGLIWASIQTPQKVSVICQQILNQYDVDPEQCERDTISVLEDLISNKLAEVAVSE